MQVYRLGNNPSLQTEIAHPPPEGNTTTFKTVKAVLITPFYLMAYAAESIVVVCLKVINFIVSAVNLYNFDALCNVNLEIEDCIQSLNQAVEWLSPWSYWDEAPKEKEELQIPKTDPTPPALPKSFSDKLKEQIVKNLNLRTAVGTAILVYYLYQTNALQKIKSFFYSFLSVPSCVSYYGIPETFEDAKLVLKCNNPFYSFADNSKGWSETKKTFRSMSILLHPDKGGNPENLLVINNAKSILERAFTTEGGQRDLKIYECISQIPTPRSKDDLSDAIKIFDCAMISLSQRCHNLEKEANRILNQIAWVGSYAKDQLSHSFSCICIWNRHWFTFNNYFFPIPYATYSKI